ncbi:MAG: hypothetical protein FH756_15425 [Firmicutes bacterium]|nr:hypothetical protein [Bacillota bacterium]
MIFTLQPGVSFDDITRKQHYFADACRREVSIERKGRYLHLNITDRTLESYYPYKWDPAPYLKKMDLPVPIGYTATGLEVVDLASLPHLRCGIPVPLFERRPHNPSASGQTPIGPPLCYTILLNHPDLPDPVQLEDGSLEYHGKIYGVHNFSKWLLSFGSSPRC